MKETLLTQFAKHWAKQRFAISGNVFLLAVSGGADSMALAHLMLQCKITFAIAHCNFQLRGEEADKDEQLVIDWCIANDILYFCTRFDTQQKAAEWKKGTQETARILRYNWFEQLRAQHKFDKIVTAHHANDNVETLLINLFKGTGIAGMHGILPQNGNIIRPLLFASKPMLTDYIAENNIEYREDASNQTDDYLRNAVRRNIIPAVQQWFPNAVTNVNESIERFGEVELLYKEAINQKRKKLIEPRGQDFYIPILKLNKQDAKATIVYELLLPYNFVSAQIPHVLNLLNAESGHFITSPTHRIIRNRDFLIITTLPTTTTDIIVIDSAPCNIAIKDYLFSFAIQDKPKTITSNPNIVYLDAQGITFPVFLRKWKIGDYFYPYGMKMKKKKISKFLIDQKVALHDKENIWVLECNKRIAWIAGMRPDERYKVKESTEKVLVVTYTQNT